MLYGLPTRQSGPLADKNRYAPWTGEAMQGRMDLDAGGQLWTVLRGTRRVGAPMGDFSCTYTGTSQPVPDITGQNLGETLLGVPREVFQRSAFIGQSALDVYKRQLVYSPPLLPMRLHPIHDAPLPLSLDNPKLRLYA